MSDPALVDRVADHLDRAGVPFALIGAAALAVHGVSRSTLDIDLLVTDRRVLESAFWISFATNAAVDPRVGDASDPLAGVVRVTSEGERDVDLVVGRGAWEAEIVARAEPVRRSGRDLPAARVDDLILLKLYAGGSQDRWDIEQLLALDRGGSTAATVDERIAPLPERGRRMWMGLRGVS
jgi:predicted nucleotidyltransferase